MGADTASLENVTLTTRIFSTLGGSAALTIWQQYLTQDRGSEFDPSRLSKACTLTHEPEAREAFPQNQSSFINTADI